MKDHEEMYQCEGETGTERKFGHAQRRQQPLLGSVYNNERGCAPAVAFMKRNPRFRRKARDEVSA
jgi:hypothetical protein